MELVSLLTTISAVLIGALSAAALIHFWIRNTSATYATTRTLMKEAEDSVTFLFDDETLVDATPLARSLMARGDSLRSDWENFVTLLSARFPHLRSQCSDLAIAGQRTITPNDGQPGWIEAEYWNGIARLTLVQEKDHPDETLDALTASAMTHELETLRAIGEDSPQLIWKRDAESVLVWANRAFIELSEALNPIGADDARLWPPVDIFQDIAAPAGNAPVIDMHRVDLPHGDQPIWYEVTSLRRGTDTIHFAVDATASVAARHAQRTFVQTMSKTFAQLSVGLAIFDADRRLVIFNPALTDLTTLPADFLIGRPTLFSVLDRLRNKSMIPEPKDYSSWRDQMVALESAAEEGNYNETWSLPDGRTYRVTGKPHPDGAIAFLMEDISDEVSLTRKFRSQIDTATGVIDSLEIAIAVFSPSGSLILVNSAYRDLWGGSSDEFLASRDVNDELEIWQSASAPSPVWIKLQESIRAHGKHSSWTDTIRLESHMTLECKYALLPDGNHQVSFDTVEHGIAQLDRIRNAQSRIAQTRTG